MSLDKNTRIAIAAGIFLVALLIRMMGIGWGLKNDLHNQSYHPDEPIIFANSQNIEPTQFKFTPGFYNYGTLYLTILRVATDMTTAYTGAPDLKNDQSFWDWMSRADMAGRFISAIAGALTAVIVFFLAYRFLGALGGLASALVIVIAPAHVMHSRFQTVDVLAVMFLAASALFALKLLPKRTDPTDPTDPTDQTKAIDPAKLVILSGVFAGLSAGTKYTGILALLTLFAAIFFVTKDRTKMLTQMAIGLGSALLAFLIVTPGAILDNAAFMRDFVYEMNHTATGHGLVFTDTSSGFIYHIGNLLLGIGLLLTIMGLGGLIWAAVKKNPWAIALLVFFVAYYVLIGRAEVKFIRYTFPLYLGIAVGFGYLLAEAQKMKWKHAVNALGIMAIGGIGGGGLMGAFSVTAWMANTDPRDQAAEWIKKQPDATTVGYVSDPWFWSVPMFKDSTIPRMPMGPDYLRLTSELRSPFLARMELMGRTTTPKPVFAFDPGPPPNYPNFNMKLLSELKPEYIAFTTFESGYLERLRNANDLDAGTKAQVDDYNRFTEQLQKDYAPVQTFGQYVPLIEDFTYVQPEVLVWKRK